MKLVAGLVAAVVLVVGGAIALSAIYAHVFKQYTHGVLRTAPEVAP